jgi:hypothetical protein
MSWNRFDRSRLMSDDDIEEWISTKRHRAMFRSEDRVD